jgi:hypothetical protein
MRRLILVGSAIVCLLVLAVAVPAMAQSDPAGLYATMGTNPDGSAYEGETEVIATGTTYRVIQHVGGTTEGTGLFTGNVLAVMFPEAGWLAAYKLRPDGTLTGVWTSAGGTETGTETLTPLR